MILRKLAASDECAFMAAVEGWGDEPGFNMAYGLLAGLSFNSYLKVLDDLREGIGLRAHEVPASSLFAFIEEEIIGRISIRHVLNEKLSSWGGHIGYGVVEKYRCQGYGTRMLREALPYCRKLGLKKILITCDENNIPSSRVIINNGGIADGVFDPQDGTPRKLRFWIQL